MQSKRVMAAKRRGRPLTVPIEFIRQRAWVVYLKGSSKGTRMDRVSSTNLQFLFIYNLINVECMNC
jgi:hypothetical protein